MIMAMTMKEKLLAGEIVVKDIQAVEKRFALKYSNVSSDAFQRITADKTITKADAMVFQYLTFNMNVNTQKTHRLKRSEIVDGTGYSDRQVYRCLLKLVEKQYIKPLENDKGKKGLLMYQIL